MKSQRSLAVALAAVLGAVFLAGCPNDSVDQRHRIGVIYPRTGQHAKLGVLVERGIHVARKQLEQSPNEKRCAAVEMILRDSEGRPAAARQSFLDLVETADVTVVVGSILSSDTKAFAAEISQFRVPVIANGSSAPDLRGISPYFFRNWPADDYEGFVMADYAATTLNIRRPALLFADDPYPRGIVRAFRDRFVGLNGQIVFEEAYNEGQVSFDTVARKLLRYNPDALYCVGFPGEIGNLVNTVRALAPDLPILSAVAIDAPEFFQLAGRAADNIFYTSPALDEASLAYLEFKSAYQTSFGEPPEIVGATSFDAAMLAARACCETDCTPEAARKWIAEVRNYQGASGDTTFDASGDVNKPVAIKRIEKGKVFVIKQ